MYDVECTIHRIEVGIGSCQKKKREKNYNNPKKQSMKQNIASELETKQTKEDVKIIVILKPLAIFFLRFVTYTQ